MTQAPPTGIAFDAEVVRVIDGDTIEVETTVRHTIRLADCWAKETRLGRNTTPDDKAKGLAAKAHLEGILARCGNFVRVWIPGNGGNLSKLSTLSRAIGRVWRQLSDRSPDATDVSGLMILAGHATKEKPES